MKLAGCVLDQHNPWLLALAAFMSVLACLTTCALLSRAQAASGRVRAVWLSLAGLEFGGGVWALHFVAMLAYMPQVRFGYALLPTAASAAVAVVVAGYAFALLLASGRAAAFGAAVLLTAGVAGMHYLGVAAMRVPGRLSLDPAAVAWSVAACLAAVLAALRPLRALRSAGQFGAATALLVLAVCGLHFQGMAALTIELGGPDAPGADGGMDTATLAACVAAFSIVMMCISLGLTVVDRHLSQRLTLEKQRLRQLVGMSFEGLLIERNGIVLDANQRVCELAGRPPPDVVGAPLHCLALSAVVRGGMAGGQPTEHRLLRSDGVFIPVECLVRPVSYEGRAANAVAVRDLIDRPRQAAGDGLLVDVARRLEWELRDGGMLAGLGGDEPVAAPGSRSLARESVVADARAAANIEALIALARALGMPVRADWVEMARQLAELRRRRCGQVQGSLPGRPARVPAEAPTRQDLAVA